MAGCVVLLIDESSAMDAPVARDSAAAMSAAAKSKAESVATAVNALLNKLAQVTDFDVALVGYRSDQDGQVNVGSRYGGSLAGRDFVKSSELAAAPLLVEKRVRKVPGPLGTTQDQSVDFPVWYKPQLGAKAPQIAAFDACLQLLTNWAATAPVGAAAPLVVNITAGSSSDGNPLRAVQKVLQFKVGDNPTLVLQAHLSSSATLPATAYPANRAYLAVGSMRDMFERVSVIPDTFLAALKAAGTAVSPKARGMIYNAKMIDITRMLSLVQVHAEPRAAAVAPVVAPKATMPLPPSSGPILVPKAAPAVAAVAAAPSAAPAAAATVTAPSAVAAPATPVEVAPPSDTATPESMPIEDVSLASGGDDLVAPLPISPAPLGPVTPDAPALILFVLDRSVEDPYAANLENACSRLQKQMGDIVANIAKKGRGAIDIGVVSYGLDAIGEPEIRSTLEGNLVGRIFARDHELMDGAIRVDEFEIEMSNGVGGIITVPRKRPIVVDVEPTGAAAATPAFATVAQMLSSWCADHSNSTFPPIVVHLTRGKLDVADAEAAIQQVHSVSTGNGATVVVYHLVATESPHPTLCYPSSETETDDAILRSLLSLSSPILGREQLAAKHPTLTEQSRGMVVNGEFQLLWDALHLALSGA